MIETSNQQTSKTLLFVPKCEYPSLVETLGAPNINQFDRNEYYLPHYQYFKPCYYSNTVLKPQKDSKVRGRIISLNKSDLEQLDAYSDEGRTLYRISTIVYGNDGIAKTVQVYIWNGNSRIGEWEAD